MATPANYHSGRRATYLWGKESRKRGWPLQVGFLEERWEWGVVQGEGIGFNRHNMGGKQRGKYLTFSLNNIWRIIFSTMREQTCLCITLLKIIDHFFWVNNYWYIFGYFDKGSIYVSHNVLAVRIIQPCLPHGNLIGWEIIGGRLQRCIATIASVDRLLTTNYWPPSEIIVSDYWLSQKHCKFIGPDGLKK